MDETRFRARLLDGRGFYLAVDSQNNPSDVYCFELAGQESTKKPLHFIFHLWPVEHDRTAGISRWSKF